MEEGEDKEPREEGDKGKPHNIGGRERILQRRMTNRIPVKIMILSPLQSTLGPIQSTPENWSNRTRKRIGQTVHLEGARGDRLEPLQKLEETNQESETTEQDQTPEESLGAT